MKEAAFKFKREEPIPAKSAIIVQLIYSARSKNSTLLELWRKAAAFFFVGLGAGMILDDLAGKIARSIPRRSPAKLIFGFVFLLFGGQYFDLLHNLWPGIPVVVGIILIWRGMKGKRSNLMKSLRRRNPDLSRQGES